MTEPDFFAMANLFPASTGLPMVIWVSERGHTRHDVRIKVCQTHGTLRNDVSGRELGQFGADFNLCWCW